MVWHFAAIWDAAARATPDAPAIVHDGAVTSWATYEQRAARIASALVAAGIGPESNVAILGYNSPGWLEAQYATFKARACPVNVNYRYTEDELAYIFAYTDAEAIFYDAGFAPRMAAIKARLPRLKLLIEIEDGSSEHIEGVRRLEEIVAAEAPLPPQAYSEEDHYMICTGGTTGLPKGVIYRQGDFAFGLTAGGFGYRGFTPPESPDQVGAAIAQIQAQGLSPRSIPACPMMHATGMSLGVMMGHNQGGCVVSFRNDHFDPDELLALIDREAATDVAIVGDAFAKPMVQALERAQAAGRPYSLKSLQRIISSGVMFSREVKERLLDFADITIIDSMGASEGGMGRSVINRETAMSDTAAFMFNPGTKVFDDNDQEVAPGSDVIGKIANGGMVPKGYYNDPEKTAATFRTIGGQRYSFPGDFAKVAADGSLILLGRGSNCINTGGEKVYPEEVEEAVKAHPEVIDCLVVGLPDERFGQRVAALVSTRAPLESADIAAFARQRLAGYKAPRTVIFVDEVKRGPNGKADYGWARERAAMA